MNYISKPGYIIWVVIIVPPSLYGLVGQLDWQLHPNLLVHLSLHHYVNTGVPRQFSWYKIWYHMVGEPLITSEVRLVGGRVIVQLFMCNNEPIIGTGGRDQGRNPFWEGYVIVEPQGRFRSIGVEIVGGWGGFIRGLVMCVHKITGCNTGQYYDTITRQYHGVWVRRSCVCPLSYLLQ